MTTEYINKVAWNKVLIFLKSLKNIYFIKENKCKRFMEAIYWMVRTGAQWRELPPKYGNWNSVFRRFNEWSKKGIWAALHAFCIEDPDLESIMIDSSIVRAHACASGYKKGQQAEQGLGRSRGGFTSKIHIKVDALGNPLQFINTPGQASDMTQAEPLTHGVKDCNVMADRGYDSDSFRSNLNKKSCNPIIPGRKNRIKAIEYDKDLYKERHLVECCFSKMKQFRRIFSRFDKTKRNFLSFLSFVGACLWLR
ncbi:MAG: IS5 family transposase [Candidatus Dependentiae bacterium]|nr:IS5 family transposase [Candidatus Dependentiae bacterium]